MDTDDHILARPSDEQDSLDDLAPAPFEDDEMMDDELVDEKVKRTGIMIDGDELETRRFADASGDDDEEALPRKIPDGMSSYMAHWIVDDEDGESASDDSEQGEEANKMDMDAVGLNTEAESAIIEGVETDAHTEVFVELSAEEEEKQLREFRARAKEDLDFPDEIEIPPNVSAKERLQRYRGVKNLRTCRWDANERDIRRPDEWSRLTRIGNYRATKNRVLKESITNSQVQAGTTVIIYIRAPETIVSFYDPEQPLIIYGLLSYEHQLSVVNMSINPNTEHTEPVASKADLIIQCGPRRLRIRPLFSQAGSNSANGVYKYERFLHPGRAATATVIAPVTFGNVPVVYFKAKEDGGLDIVGSGSVLDADKNRILAKRVVITGHPLKIHKKLVTIRYMFFTPEDVQWFKAVPLFTKMGRSGYIKESLGTHGYFKATFDGKLNSQDTVGMALYKRVWPRISMVCDF
jgi:pre-rRNA-processing protein TSR1